MDKMIPSIYGKPMASEKSHPPKGGPIILPSESNEERSPVALPCPVVDTFVINAETLGRMKPFPMPKMVRKIAAVAKLLTNKISPNPIAEIRIRS